MSEIFIWFKNGDIKTVSGFLYSEEMQFLRVLIRESNWLSDPSFEVQFEDLGQHCVWIENDIVATSDGCTVEYVGGTRKIHHAVFVNFTPPPPPSHTL